MKGLQLTTLVLLAFILSDVQGLFGRRERLRRKKWGYWRNRPIEHDFFTNRNNPRGHGMSSWRRRKDLVLPAFYTINSAGGPASDIQWNRMGKYKRSRDEKNNGHPVWVNYDGSEKLFYASDGKWVIGNPETEVGGLESVERGPAGVPSYPWRYYSDGVWAVDQLLTVTVGEPVYPKGLNISSAGPAAEKQPAVMGTYLLVPGREEKGRPVWKHRHNDLWLFYNGAYWMVGSDPTTDYGWIISPKSSQVKIPVHGWEYDEDKVEVDDHEGLEWVKDEKLTVEEI